jgi:hypothetical protein
MNLLYSKVFLKIGCKLFRPMDPNANPAKLRQVWYRVVFFSRMKYSASFLDKLFDMINEDMIRLKSWFDANLLALNVDKINFVIFER